MYAKADSVIYAKNNLIVYTDDDDDDDNNVEYRLYFYNEII